MTATPTEMMKEYVNSQKIQHNLCHDSDERDVQRRVPTAHAVLGVNVDGNNDILEIWIGEQYFKYFPR